MRILFIHNRYRQEGGEDIALDLEVRLLQQKGHVVSTLLFDNEGMEGFVKKIGRGVQALYNRRSARVVERTIREFRPELVHVHNLFFTASPSVIRVAARHGLPVVLTLHNYRLICANALLLRDNQPCNLCVQKVFPLDGIRYKCYRGSAIETGLVTAVTGLHKILRTWQHKVDAYITLTGFACSPISSSTPERGNPRGKERIFSFLSAAFRGRRASMSSWRPSPDYRKASWSSSATVRSGKWWSKPADLRPILYLREKRPGRKYCWL
jgi:Glycosyl transferase 4-like domain